MTQKLDIQVALKVPKPGDGGRCLGRERFYREARQAARMVHPGLAWVLDVGQVDGLDYLVMRYVAGDPAFPISGRHAPRVGRPDPRGGDRDGRGA